jgi:cysteinyl-tRNA synthetase
MYTCGPTVYDYAHIGNFRAYVFEDLLRRWLIYRGFRVTQVMNITDVDDKTIANSIREGAPLETYTERFTQAFFEDLKALRIQPAEHYPRATRFVPHMQKMIQMLIDQKHAYVTDGSVYYRISTFPHYGKLSKKNLEENIAGARVDSDEYEKESVHDFALWKKAKEGEPSWDSPWGKMPAMVIESTTIKAARIFFDERKLTRES